MDLPVKEPFSMDQKTKWGEGEILEVVAQMYFIYKSGCYWAHIEVKLGQHSTFSMNPLSNLSD